MIELLITLLFVAVIVYILYLILGMIAIPAPIKNIIYLILGLVLIMWLLSHFGIYNGSLR